MRPQTDDHPRRQPGREPRRRSADDADLRDDDVHVRHRRGGQAVRRRAARRSSSTRATATRRCRRWSRRSPRSRAPSPRCCCRAGRRRRRPRCSALLKAGDEVVCSSAIYGGTLHLLADLLPEVRDPHAVRDDRGAAPSSIASSARRDEAGVVRVADQPDAALRRHRRDRRRLPRARRDLGHRQHVRQPGQPAADRARRRPRDAQRDEVPERPQRRDRRRAGRAGAR